MFWMTTALALELGIGVQETTDYGGDLDGPRLLVRGDVNPWIRWMAAATWNPAPDRLTPWDEAVLSINGATFSGLDYVHTVEAELVAIQVGVDAGPVVFDRGRWSVGPRAHAGLEPRLVRLSIPSLDSQPTALPESSVAMGIYGGLSGEVWFEQRVGFRLSATQRPWAQGLQWTRVNSRTAELMVRF